MKPIGSVVYVGGVTPATVLETATDGALVREHDDASEGWHDWANLPDRPRQPLSIGARPGSVGVGHFDVRLWLGVPNQTRAGIGQVTLREEEVDPFVQLVTEAQLNAATVGEPVDRELLQRTCIAFWMSTIDGRNQCARDLHHRGQHVAVDADGIVTAVWLLAEVVAR